MRISTFFVVVLSIVCTACSVQKNTQNKDKAWRSLFNGRDLSGWSHAGDGDFIVEDGLLISRGGMGILWYKEEQFADVELRIVYRTSPNSNSGVFIRIPEPVKEPWMPVHKGYEVQIDDNGDDFHSTGVLYSLTQAKARPETSEGWNTMNITLDHDRTMVSVNGELVTDYREGEPVAKRQGWWEPERGPRPLSGYVGLQNHDAQSKLYVQSISVRHLKSK